MTRNISSIYTNITFYITSTCNISGINFNITVTSIVPPNTDTARIELASLHIEFAPTGRPNGSNAASARDFSAGHRDLPISRSRIAYDDRPAAGIVESCIVGKNQLTIASLADARRIAAVDISVSRQCQRSSSGFISSEEESAALPRHFDIDTPRACERYSPRA